MYFNFEKLDVWKEAIDFSYQVKIKTNEFPRNELFGITSQLIRAATSISSNIAEGAGRYNTKDYIRFLYIARGSIYESVSLLNLALLNGYLNKDEFHRLNKLCHKIAAQLGALILSLKRRL